jgi:hypothetical protein
MPIIIHLNDLNVIGTQTVDSTRNPATGDSPVQAAHDRILWITNRKVDSKRTSGLNCHSVERMSSTNDYQPRILEYVCYQRHRTPARDATWYGARGIDQKDKEAGSVSTTGTSSILF